MKHLRTIERLIQTQREHANELRLEANRKYNPRGHMGGYYYRRGQAAATDDICCQMEELARAIRKDEKTLAHE